MLLIKSFIETLKDPRDAKGLRHSFENLMTMIIIGHCLNYTGYRGVARFAKGNEAFLSQELDLPYGVPCHNTFRRLLQKLKSTDVLAAFNAWAAQHFPIVADEPLSIDGQALCSTVTNYDNEEQNFAAVVSLFSHTTGLTRAMAMYENKKVSELHAVVELLAIVLPDNPPILQQADALHSKKKLWRVL